MNKEVLRDWLIKALSYYNGEASIVEVCKYVWENHEEQLRNSGDLFYTWQYDIRWMATNLRREGIIKDAKLSPQGIWELTNKI